MPSSMPLGTPIWRRYLLLAVLLACVLGPVAAAGQAKIHVSVVTPAVQDGALLVGVECAQLFSPRSLSTLQSGLPAVLQLELRLLRGTRTQTMLGLGQEEFELVRTVREAHSIRYDVWDERYTIGQRGRDPQVVETVQAAESLTATFSAIELASLTQLATAATYKVRARVQLLPISEEQGDRVADWLREPDALGGIPDDGEEGRFGFDVSELLSALWGGGKPTRDRSDWFEGDGFRLDVAGNLQP
jgi:hypothetical protein